MTTFNNVKNTRLVQATRGLLLSTLPFTLVAGLPTVTNAATLGGSRTVVVLFTGANQGGANDTNTGMFKLNERLKNEFGNAPNGFSSMIFQGGDVEVSWKFGFIPTVDITDGDINGALNYIKGFNDIGFLGLIGYSLGGDTAIEVAKELAPTGVDLLVTIDPFGLPSPDTKPSNVTAGFNYLQNCENLDIIGGFVCNSPGQIKRGETLAGKQVNGSKNINVEEIFQDRSITHGGSKGIDKDSRVHNLIVENIRQFLFPKTFSLSAGINDNFAGGTDPANPSQGLIKRLDVIEKGDSTQNVFPLMNFDELSDAIDRYFAHTFTGLPQGTYTSAKLEIGLKPNDNIATTNDFIELSFTGSNGNLLNKSWNRRIGDCAGFVEQCQGEQPGLLEQLGLIPTWNTENYAGGKTFTFDLANLLQPNGTTFSLLSALQSNRFLDVVVGDDTSVDFVKLTINAKEVSVPEPTSALGILAFGALGAGSVLKRKQQQKALDNRLN